MATVEAMANGCVPVVLARGGQPEIVEDNISGFLCQSLAEMTAQTERLAGDPALWTRMSSAARRRAGQFDRASFTSRLKQLAPFL
jgi:glycosyltransferase involved in cell wall biosynthesis